MRTLRGWPGGAPPLMGATLRDPTLPPSRSRRPPSLQQALLLLLLPAAVLLGHVACSRARARLPLLVPQAAANHAAPVTALVLNRSASVALRVRGARAPQRLQATGAAAGDTSGPCAQRLAIYGSQDGWASYVSVQYFHLFRLLQHAYGWVTVPHQGAPGSWDALGRGVVAALGGHAPDVLLLMEDYGALSSLTGSKADSPLARTQVWMFTNDLHWREPSVRALKAAGLAAADLMLGPYAYQLDHFYPELAGLPRFWVPHGASSLYQLPLRPHSAVAQRVFLSGASYRDHYPYRAIVADKISAGDARFEQQEHPGYNNPDPETLGARFAARLNSYLACVTDGLIYNYTVAKMLELPAAGCLLLVNGEMAPILAQLGFVAGTHYLAYTAASLDAVVDAVLDPANAAAVDALRAQGQALVWARHTVAHRAAAVHERAAAACGARPQSGATGVG